MINDSDVISSFIANLAEDIKTLIQEKALLKAQLSLSEKTIEQLKQSNEIMIAEMANLKATLEDIQKDLIDNDSTPKRRKN